MGKPIPKVFRAPRRTALIIEDDYVVRKAIRIFLERDGWAVLGPDSIEGAWKESRLNLARIDALIVDIVLARGNGAELGRRLLHNKPDLACLLISDSPLHNPYARDLLEEPVFKADRVRVLEKPFTMASLLGALHRLVDSKTRPDQDRSSTLAASAQLPDTGSADQEASSGVAPRDLRPD
ncbi:MAG: response regulator [Bryobacteraceae bacterium]